MPALASIKTLFRLSCLSALFSVSASVLYADTYHLVSPTASGVTPSGQSLQIASTSNSGFTPSLLINPSPNYWYGPTITGSYAAGTWSLLTWTNQPGCASNVTAEIGYSNPDGSGFVSLGLQTLDLNATGAGNHPSNFTFSVPFNNLINKRLRVSLVLSSGCGTTVAYNAGVDFDSRLSSTAFGPSGTPTLTPSFSPSPTTTPTLPPAVIKSVDNASPLLGDTITYTLTYKNPNAAISNNCSDDFESGTAWPSGWSPPTGGTWALATDNGPSAAGTQSLDAQETGGFHYSIFQCASNVTDGSIQSDVKIMSAGGKVTQLWRQNGASAYQFHVEQGSSGNISLRVITNGAFLELALGNFVIPLNTWFTMRFVVMGFTLQGYINGSLVLSATDPNVTYNSGGAGVEIDDPATIGMHARFDNIIINKNSMTWYNVSMIDTLPTGLSYLSSTGGGSASGQVVSFQLGTVTAQTQSTRQIVVKVNVCGSVLPNTADLSVGLPAQNYTSNVVNITPLCASPTFTATATLTATLTPSPSSSPTPSATATPSSTASFTATGSSTISPTPSMTATPSASSSQTPSFSASPTQTVSPTASPSPQPMPFQVSASIYNSAGELVRHLYAGVFSNSGLGNRLSQGSMQAGQTGCTLLLDGMLKNGAKQLDIDGRNDQGQLLSGGSYVVKWESIDSFGQVQTQQFSLLVLPGQPKGNLGIFSSSGELVAMLPLPSGLSDLNDLTVIDGGAFTSAKGVGLNIRDSQGRSAIQLWDGRNAQGLAVASGTYMVRAMGDSSQGQGKVWTLQIVQALGTLSEPIVAPNPVPATATHIGIVLGPGFNRSAQVFIHDLNGALVAEGVELIPGRMDIPLSRWASGIYVVSISQRDLLGQVHRWRKKVAVLR